MRGDLGTYPVHAKQNPVAQQPTLRLTEQVGGWCVVVLLVLVAGTWNCGV